MFGLFKQIDPMVCIKTFDGDKDINTKKFMPWCLVRAGYYPEYYIYYEGFTTPSNIDELPVKSYAVKKSVYDKMVKIHNRVAKTLRGESYVS